MYKSVSDAERECHLNPLCLVTQTQTTSSPQRKLHDLREPFASQTPQLSRRTSTFSMHLGAGFNA
ncbi:hypothetical protein CC78DRAFT_529678 [Lojkania enalia]|uniref:Uncharacterized protein n=1 Tax=Lojkania enalia TaxID=147567 RepID=A0A9P4KIL2_9PLEO|nr:hypothetical protein CC78DRAFT_529678 [Didymosphaeria enalia]